MYRDGLLTYFTLKRTEGQKWHADGPSVDNEKFPIVHVYSNKTADTITALVGIRPISDKGQQAYVPASHASMTLLLTGAVKVVQHYRQNQELALGEVATTLVLHVASTDGMQSARPVAPDAHNASTSVNGFSGGRRTGESKGVGVINAPTHVAFVEQTRQPQDALND